MKPCLTCLSLIAACLSTQAFCATDPSFLLTASAKDFDNYFPGQLANGFISTMTAPRGSEGNLAYMVAFMDYAKDDISRPAAIPGWTEIDYSTGPIGGDHVWMNQVRLTPSVFEDYHQVLNMYDATLTTSYRYLDHGKATRVEVVTMVSQASPHLAASQLSITPEFDGEVQLSFALNLWAPYQPRLPLAKLTGDELPLVIAAHNLVLDAIPPATADRAAEWYHGDTHVLADDGDSNDLTLWLDGRAEQGLAMAQAAAIGLPKGLTPVEVKLVKNDYRLALDLRVAVHKGETYTFTKFVATSREGWGGDARADAALATAARSQGFTALLDAHKSAWAQLWKSDIHIDGDPKVQRVVHSDLYYLLSNIAPDTAWSIGACAMTPGYVGHVFWDSDSWMFPALLLQHPQYAKSLVMFRSRTLPAAQQRARDAGFQGAKYPWEADPENGTEQILHAAWILSRSEIHVNADVAIAQWQYWLATHDLKWLRADGWPVIRNVAEFWASRATYNEKMQRYDIEHVTSVEENYYDVPNDTFTNLEAAKALNIAVAAAALVGAKPDSRWADIAAKLYVPFSATANRHLDMDESVKHDEGGSDLTFLAFPSLDASMSAQVRRNDFAFAVDPREASERIPSTMGAAPIGIAAAALGDVAETTRWVLRNAADDMFKGPFNVRPETSDNNTGYFLTGSGGFLQSLIFGLSGLRLEERGLVEAYAPVLPPEWKSLTLQNVTFRGKRFDITIDRDTSGKVRLTRKAI
ncbi:MAG TPA: glycosyl hydrolase family 65 protein [Rudaea sp.]|jgi:trehalose/maltose hydrolase-like predicted phosphorylase|uniref:glycosyl hydrolase family 65 protein n=1 Tax=Rudaea sp. TaxID=2136325 RepID=UPI002F941BD6